MEEKYTISGKPLQRHFNLNQALIEFDKLFIYNTGDDRAIVIIGASFIDILIEHILLAFFPEDDSEVKRLLDHDQPLGTFGNRIKLVYCLGLIEKVIKDDLKLIGKIRNKFAHDLFASFENEQIKDWCQGLRWHKISMMMDPPEDATTRDLYQVGVNQLITYLNGIVGIAHGQKRTIMQHF